MEKIQFNDMDFLFNPTHAVSFMNGDYSNVGGYNVYICSSLSFMSVVATDDEDTAYTFQGNEADNVIEEITDLWLNNPTFTQRKAVEQWISLNL